jgi:hypothetical protein
MVVGAALPATAGDVVIMPFSCAVVGGKPVLTPSDDQAYRILSTREQRKVQTCSTVDAKRCRQWATFKFDMDCGGERVAWMQVFANAGVHTRRRVWENNGRLRVADTPRRDRRIDDMCARRLGANMEWWSVNELCEEASPLNAPTATDMPAGFAPMVGLDATVLPEEALRSRSHRLALAKSQDLAKSQEKSAAAKEKDAEATAEPGGETPTADDVSARVHDASPTEVAAVEPEVQQRAPAPSPAAPEQSVARAEPEAQAGSSRHAAPAPVAVLNAPGDAQPPAAAAHDAQAKETAATPDASLETVTAAKADRLTQAATRPVDAAPALAEPSPVAARPQETVVAKARDGTTSAATVAQAVDVPSTGPQPTAIPQTTGSIEAAVAEPDASTAPAMTTTLSLAIAAFAAAALVMMGLVLNWLYRSPGGAGDKAMGDNLMDHTLPEEGMSAAIAGRGDVTSAAFAASALVPVRASPQHLTATHGAAPPSTRVPDRFGLGDRMPANKPEALAVLGMGVAGEGNLASLKKIIDGLRMNWHPDLARDDMDRRTRELRLKQINAAWEILGEKRAEA